MICIKCDIEYDKKDRLGKPGRITLCSECYLEEGDEVKYTANLIWSHKTAPSLQINKDPRVTHYLNGNSKDFDSEHEGGSVAVEAESFHNK